MADYYEIDFLDVETDSSGDAITVRYEVGGETLVHVVDGGYQVTGPAICSHIKKHYSTTYVDHVVVTHCDRDHTGGLATVLEEMDVGILWMLRPWEYAEELLPRFATYTSVDRLRARLKGIYSKLVELEEIANRKGILILDPFQGATIGAFTVMAPSRARYLDLIVASENTPESVEEAAATPADRMRMLARAAMKKAAQIVAALWGDEMFSIEETSAENEMSVVQFARLSNHRILLTGDAGRAALTEAADYAPMVGLVLPGLDKIQIPHHGSRRNVSTEILDRWLGPRLRSKPAAGGETFSAIVSSAKADPNHPRNSVKRAFIHRGGAVFETESRSIRSYGGAAPNRDGWGLMTPADYPNSQES